MRKKYILKIAEDVGITTIDDLNTDDNMRIEYSAPLQLHLTTDQTNAQLIRRSSVVLPRFAIEDSQGWQLLSEAYARHRDELRAGFAFQEAEKARGN